MFSFDLFRVGNFVRALSRFWGVLHGRQTHSLSRISSRLSVCDKDNEDEDNEDKATRTMKTKTTS